MLRVLVVDDSPVARDLLVEILANDPEIEVVGTANDGRDAIERFEALRPDVVTMDVQMPRMDGYAATREIMARWPTPIVVVSGSGTRPDVEKSIASLEAGALTVIGKPPSPQSPRFVNEAARLVATVKAMAGVKVVRMLARRAEARATLSKIVAEKESQTVSGVSGWDGSRTTSLVAIAASTGGPQVLQSILAALPATYPIPIAIVQHISSGFTEGLAHWLNGAVGLDVRVPADGEPLAGGQVFLAPEGSHLGVGARGRAEFVDRPPVAGFRPSGTVLFETAARGLGAQVVAVVLTGMGADGVDGLRSVRQCGGRVLAQSPETCVVDGMPSAAIAAGVVDRILAPAEIGRVLVELAARPPERRSSESRSPGVRSTGGGAP